MSQSAPIAVNFPQLLASCEAKAADFSTRERDFLSDVRRLIMSPTPRGLTEKQAGWLAELAAREPINFAAINSAALGILQELCERWLPDGRLQAKEWIALNPMRCDTRAGSFRINVDTGRWADFADAAARGGDPVSLAAYLHCSGDQLAGAIALKGMLGL